MVNSYGLDGNVGHEMTDKEYRELVKSKVDFNNYYASRLAQSSDNIHIPKQAIWLHVMGLMETWDMI